MTLGIARPLMSPASLPALRSLDPRNGGEDPARIRATIARAPLFAALPITAIEDLTARVSVRKVPVGSAVVAQDEPGDAMFVIMSGRVKVVIFGESGREVTLSLLRSGDSFGEMSLFDQGPRSAHCLAIEPTTLPAASTTGAPPISNQMIVPSLRRTRTSYWSATWRSRNRAFSRIKATSSG